jgi:hypothetical protein
MAWADDGQAVHACAPELVGPHSGDACQLGEVCAGLQQVWAQAEQGHHGLRVAAAGSKQRRVVVEPEVITQPHYSYGSLGLAHAGNGCSEMWLWRLVPRMQYRGMLGR